MESPTFLILFRIVIFFYSPALETVQTDGEEDEDRTGGTRALPGNQTVTWREIEKRNR